MAPTPRELVRALANPVRFAEVLCGQPLWPHQIEVAMSPARFRVICAGRQCGKSRLLAVLSLHQAFLKPGSLVLIISATEIAAKRVLGEVAATAQSELLRASVVDETKGMVMLSNGSQIISVPASEKQIRGWSIDLLVLDEAAYIKDEIWTAAQAVIIARPNARIVLASTPGGGPEHFFRKIWQRGMDSPDAMWASWHWPCTVSPLIDTDLLEEFRKQNGEIAFRREYLAEWGDIAGSFLTEDEIWGAVADYELVTPDRMRSWSPWDRWTERHDRIYTAAGGVDWAFSIDAQALVLVSALDDGGLNPGNEHRYYIPWMEYAYRTRYADWISRVTAAARGYGLRVVASETNGVGAHPTEALADEMARSGLGCHVAAVWTDLRRKQSGFGKIKMMLQRDLLVLPREPELLKQLRGLEYATMPSGSVSISVPERAGHDDIAMALMQALSCIRPSLRHGDEIPPRQELPHTGTPSGIRVPAQPRPVAMHAMSYMVPAGRERDREPAW